MASLHAPAYTQGETMLRSISLTIAIAVTLMVSTVYMVESTKYSLPFKTYYSSLTPDAREEVECLAENIYFESAMEPTEGKLAVAFVTMNRLKSGKFADSICGVVKQKIQNVCQFSWWCEDKPKAIATSKVLTNGDNKLYNAIRDIAMFVYINYERVSDPSNGAMFYHADYVNPRWPNMIRTNIIGRHIFYNRKSYEKGELV
jgi:N-acetylmuramoyl-L-alanine amidase